MFCFAFGLCIWIGVSEGGRALHCEDGSFVRVMFFVEARKRAVLAVVAAKACGGQLAVVWLAPPKGFQSRPLSLI